MGLRTWGRFERWSTEIRAALVWAGFADPCETRSRIVDDDPERDSTQAVLAAWHDEFAEEPIQTAMIINAVSKEHERHRQDPGYQPSPLFTAISAVATTKSGLSALRFGQWCGAHADGMVGGLRLRKSLKEHGINRWRVVRDVKRGLGTEAEIDRLAEADGAK